MSKKARTRKYTITARAGIGLGFALVLLSFFATRSLLLTLLSFFIIFILPYIGWSAVSEVGAERFLQYFLVGRIQDNLLPRTLQERFLPRDYFRSTSSYPLHLGWRFYQVLLFIFFLSSLTVQYLPPIIVPVTPLSKDAEFVIYGIAFLTFLAPIIGLTWVYEDWGLRGIDKLRNVAYPIGSTLARYVAGFGSLGTVARFVLSTSSSGIVGAVTDTFVLLAFLVPPCLIVTAIFHDQREPEILEKLSGSDIARAIRAGSLRVVAEAK